LQSLLADARDVTSHHSAVPRGLREPDLTALITIQSLTSSPPIRRGAVMLSHLGEHALAWAALGLVGALRDPGQRRLWLEATATVVNAHAVSIVIKHMVHRRRPSDPHVKAHVTTPSDWSFPSSHAASTTAAAVAYSRLLGSRYPLLSIPAMLISRVVLGVHYPSDVLGGSVIGAALGYWVTRTKTVSPS
jgi:membrane-associated phospholipid phosphatase